MLFPFSSFPKQPLCRAAGSRPRRGNVEIFATALQDSSGQPDGCRRAVASPRRQDRGPDGVPRRRRPPGGSGGAPSICIRRRQLARSLVQRRRGSEAKFTVTASVRSLRGPRLNLISIAYTQILIGSWEKNN